jgi:hypothetical protein
MTCDILPHDEKAERIYSICSPGPPRSECEYARTDYATVDQMNLSSQIYREPEQNVSQKQILSEPCFLQRPPVRPCHHERNGRE